MNNSHYLHVFFSKIDIPKLKKTLLKELNKILSYFFQSKNELDTKMHTLVNAIDLAILMVIPKIRQSPKSVAGFDEEFKEMQMKVRKLKKI